ncbi:MAG: hypothetical protein WC825_08190 [Gallionellaceae bacterium]|jgi:hypothetical protein
MKISSTSNEGMSSMHTPHHAHEPLFFVLRRALREFLTTLDKIQVAIVLSEAGDVEGAKALLGKHAK